MSKFIQEAFQNRRRTLFSLAYLAIPVLLGLLVLHVFHVI